jgi:hypothetical protein
LSHSRPTSPHKTVLIFLGNYLCSPEGEGIPRHLFSWQEDNGLPPPLFSLPARHWGLKLHHHPPVHRSASSARRATLPFSTDVPRYVVPHTTAMTARQPCRPARNKLKMLKQRTFGFTREVHTRFKWFRMQTYGVLSIMVKTWR